MDYEKGVAEGTIDPKVSTFEEAADTSITANAESELKKEGEKKAAAGAVAAADTAEAMDLPPELDPTTADAAPAKMLMQKQAWGNHEFADLD